MPFRGWAAALLLLSVSVSACARAQPDRRVTPTPPRLTVAASPELSAAAARLERYDAARLGNVMRLVGLNEPGPPIAVVLAAEDSDLGRGTPRWIAGFADGRRSQVVLFPSRAPTYPYDTMEELLHHEVAHVLISRAAGGAAVPRWFHEGLAMAAERTWRIADHRQLAVAALGNRPSIARLDAEFDGGPDRAARAYGVSGAFVRDLLRRHGAAAPGAILSRLAAGDTFAQAFGAATGTSLDEAEAVFWRYSWWNQLVPALTSTLSIWLVIVLLAGWAVRRRRQRRAALRERWEREEDAEPFA